VRRAHQRLQLPSAPVNAVQIVQIRGQVPLYQPSQLDKSDDLYS
jgi:hypothetical protein